ncbi:hypothetical protein ACH4E7_13870 [Kitasatospora sp. NPDC018058]|uniref:WXG100-like domain-containing protein n=1 Tax=Kitasatospora sp. NPDC018058 TaxID=3364025 RepID=UPI0037BE2879
MGESTAAKAVQKLTGMWWPDADPDKLRKVADAWDAMATAIDNVTVPTNQAAAAIVANNHGPAIDAFGKFWGQYYGGKDSAGKGKGWLPETADACRALAKALRDFAHEVDKAVKKLEEEAAIVGATLVAGTALAFFTAGISEGVAAGAAAGIVATAAGLGVAVSETIATIAATVLVGAAFGAVEAITVDLAVAQPIRVELFDDGGYSAKEALDSAKTGEIMGAAGGGLGAGGRVVANAAERAEGASVALAGLAKVANAADTLPGRMVTGAGLTYGYDTAFKTGPIMPLDLILGAVGGAAAPGRGKTEFPDTEGWGGAGWVEKPTKFAGDAFEKIRATPNKVDLPKISENTGIDLTVLRQVKSHLFREQHKVEIAPLTSKTGLFTPRDDIAALWQDAHAGKLDAAGLKEFHSLMAHEYIESELMRAGLPYVSDHPAVWDSDNSKLSPKDVSKAGAHDLSPHPVKGHFRAWEDSLGITPPKTALADDLSNIDSVVSEIKQELKRNGVKLK